MVFYCWECVSFLKDDRSVDLVITNRDTMLAFVHGMQFIIDQRLKKSYTLAKSNSLMELSKSKKKNPSTSKNDPVFK